MAATRAAERRNGSGRAHAPRLKGPDEGHSQGGSGVREEQRPTGTEDTNGARGAGTGSHRPARGCWGSSLGGGASLSGGDGVDATTVSFLLRVNLQRTKEEKRRRVLEDEEKEEEKLMQEIPPQAPC